MATCGNCGQMNMAESHFCRFCGTKLVKAQPEHDPFAHAAPPRPYAWKTDEFQTQQEARRTHGALNQHLVQPPSPGQPAAYQQPQHLSQPYRCPHCMSQFLPRVERRISTAGWITFAVLLVFFFPLFWIGLLIKEDVRTCPTCTRRVS